MQIRQCLIKNWENDLLPSVHLCGVLCAEALELVMLTNSKPPAGCPKNKPWEVVRIS